MGRGLFVVLRDVAVVLGIALFGVLLHEGVHVIDAVEPSGVCLDFHEGVKWRNSFMSTHYNVAVEPGGSQLGEFWPYVVQFGVSLFLALLYGYYSKKYDE